MSNPAPIAVGWHANPLLRNVTACPRREFFRVSLSASDPRREMLVRSNHTNR